MAVHIDEVSTVIEPTGADSGQTPGEQPSGAAPPPFEVQIEELRPLVRALLAEELERWLRNRGERP